MRVVVFTHSLVSCWNHGNAHFVRGITRELLARGNGVPTDRACCRRTGTVRRPTIAACIRRAAAARASDHLLRAGRLRAPAASRHRPTRLGAGRRLPGDSRRLRAGDARRARADLVVKASGVGVFDDAEAHRARSRSGPGTRACSGTSTRRRRSTRCAPSRGSLRRADPGYDMVLTYGGGPPVVAAYRGVRRADMRADLQRARPGDAPSGAARSALRRRSGLLATACRIARRGSIVLFRAAAGCCRDAVFARRQGWGDKAMPANVRVLGHVYTRDHNGSTARRSPCSTSPRQHGGFGFSRRRGCSRRPAPEPA